jgi:hypothetical protein
MIETSAKSFFPKVEEVIQQSVNNTFKGFQENVINQVEMVPMIGSAIRQYFQCVLGDQISKTLEALDYNVSIPRLQVDDFHFDTKSLLALAQDSTTQLQSLTHSSQYDTMFLNQFEKFKEMYVEWMRWQSYPFLFSMGLGFSLFLVGIPLLLCHDPIPTQ